MNIKKMIFLIVLLFYFVSCQQNNATCNSSLNEDKSVLIGVWQTKFRYSEGNGYQTFPHISSDIHTYEYLAFSKTGKAYFAIRKIDYKNQETKLTRTKTFDFISSNDAMKWIYDDGSEMVYFLFDGEVLTTILRNKDEKISIYSYQKTKGVLLEDIQNAELEP